MLELVFPCTNRESARAKWSLSSGSPTAQYSAKNTGLCAAMTAFWIKRSLELGGPGSLTNAAQIGAEHRMGILQGSRKYNSALLDFVIEAVGLSHGNALYGNGCVGGLLANDIAGMNGFVYFAITLVGRGGHAMGAFIGPNSYYFFDPNHGLYRGSRRTDFVAHVGNSLDSEYGDICDNWGRVEVY